MLPLAIAAAAATACSQDDPFRPVATAQNSVSNFNLAALSTGVGLPSALDLVNLRTVRPSLDGAGTPNFQLAFDVTSDGRILLVPALRVVNPPGGATSVGLVRTNAAFDALERAPTDGFANDSTVTVAIGETWVVRIDPQLCSFGDAFFAKLVVDDVNALTRRMAVRVLINRNCGYRDLTVGLPRN